MKSKCPALALAVLGLLAPPARAGPIHYAVGVPGGSDVYRVPADGSSLSTRELLTLNVFAVGWLTTRPHAQAGGQPTRAGANGGADAADQRRPDGQLTGQPTFVDGPWRERRFALNIGSTSPEDLAVGVAWDVTRDGVNFTSGSTFEVAFTPDDLGVYEVSVSATDRDGDTGSLQWAVTEGSPA